MTDGNLRKLFQKHLPEAMWTPVETWSTGQGVPDVEYIFPNGASGWIENKLTTGWAVDISPHQVSWLERRARMGGRCFIAVRRQIPSGLRRGPSCDELWLFNGASARDLAKDGIKGIDFIDFQAVWPGGPANWDWALVKQALSA